MVKIYYSFFDNYSNMIKYLLVFAVVYYIYQQYFLGRNTDHIDQKDKQANQNNSKEEYVDYEEVD